MAYILNVQNLCDDDFKYLPNRQTISSYFTHFAVDEDITVLNLRDNGFVQSETITVISRIIKRKFPNLKLVDLRGNSFGDDSMEPLKRLIRECDVFVDVNENNMLLTSPNLKTVLQSFTEQELEKLIWIPMNELYSMDWSKFHFGDDTKIAKIVETHRIHYDLPQTGTFFVQSNRE